MQPDSFTDLVQMILPILPQATFGTDNEGQIIIYTNKSFVADQTAEGTDDIIDMPDVD